MKRFSLIAAVVFVFASALQARDLFRILPEPQGRIHPEAAATNSMRVEVDKDALAESDVSVSLGGKTYRVSDRVVEWTKHEIATSQNVRDYTARFTLDGSQNPSVLIRYEGVMAGMIVTPDNVSYELDPNGDANLLTRVDITKFHCEAVEPETESRVHVLVVNPTMRHRAVHLPNDNYTIDLAEFYTPLAMAGAGGQAQMEALIQAAVAMLNESVRRSGIQNLTFRLVYTGTIQFDERDPKLTSYQDVLNFITGSTEASASRSRVGADLVGLWIDGGGGIAWAPRYYGAFRPSNGFHVIGRTLGLYVAGFEHEVGHNLGLQHDPPMVSASGSDDFPFARGVCTAQFITVMSSASCIPNANSHNTNWIPYYSNTDPTLSYNGQPMGSAMQDNVRMMRIGAPIVANYFPGASSKSP
jgi:hypothetical protein